MSLQPRESTAANPQQVPLIEHLASKMIKIKLNSLHSWSKLELVCQVLHLDSPLPIANFHIALVGDGLDFVNGDNKVSLLVTVLN